MFGAPSLVAIIRAAYRTFFDDQNRLLETDFKVISGTQNDAVDAKIKTFEELGFRVELKPMYPEFSWLEWDGKDLVGKFINAPSRELIPEKITEQLIVELYSK